MKHRFDAVMFDLDGTLTDTLADLANATNHALATLGCPTHPRLAYRKMVGDGARMLCQRALPPDRQDLVEEARRLMREHYDAHCFDETRVYAGIAALLQALRDHELLLAVLSNKPDEFTKRVVDHYFQPNPFTVVRGHLAHLPLKPDPTVALQIAEQVGIPPARWLYLGDTNTDMETATRAGMYAVGALWGFRDRVEIEEAGARFIAATPADLLKL